MKHQVNRRKQPRYITESGMAASLGESRVGLITDVSEHGLSFRFVASPNEIEMNSEYASEVSITRGDFAISNIPCKIVMDYYLLEEYGATSTLKMFKCCLQFDNPAADHKAHLAYLINNFTEGPLRQKEKNSDQSFLTD